jgi:hypothetical protein
MLELDDKGKIKIQTKWVLNWAIFIVGQTGGKPDQHRCIIIWGREPSNWWTSKRALVLRLYLGEYTFILREQPLGRWSQQPNANTKMESKLFKVSSGQHDGLQWSVNEDGYWTQIYLVFFWTLLTFKICWLGTDRLVELQNIKIAIGLFFWL